MKVFICLLSFIVLCSAGFSGPRGGPGGFHGKGDYPNSGPGSNVKIIKAIRQNGGQQQHHGGSGSGGGGGPPTQVIRVIHQNSGPPPSRPMTVRVIHDQGQQRSREQTVKVIHQHNHHRSHKPPPPPPPRMEHDHDPVSAESKVIEIFRGNNYKRPKSLKPILSGNGRVSNVEARIVELIRGLTGRKHKANDQQIIEIIREENNNNGGNNLENRILEIIRQEGITSGRKRKLARGSSADRPTPEEMKILQIIRETLGHKPRVLHEDEDFDDDQELDEPFVFSDEVDDDDNNVKIIHDDGEYDSYDDDQTRNNEIESRKATTTPVPPPPPPPPPPPTKIVQVLQPPPPVRHIFRTVRVLRGHRDMPEHSLMRNFNSFGGGLRGFNSELEHEHGNLKLLKVFNH